MLGPPIDAWYAWIAVALASLALAGTGLALSTPASPDAMRAAATVDEVAASDPPTIGRHPVSADRVAIEPYRIELEADGRTSTAAFESGPVVPAASGASLAAVARGTPPERAFDSPAEFRRAVEAARERAVDAQAGDELAVRSVAWGDVDVTLVAP